MLEPKKKEAESLYRAALRLSGNRNTDPPEAWRLVSQALAIAPDHLDANILAGELWLAFWDEIGYEDHSRAQAAAVALPYFERALDLEPRQSDAWSGKSHSLRNLGRYPEALAAAESGLAALGERVDYLSSDRVYRYVAEELYDALVRVLLALGRRDEARQRLEEGLSLFPGSSYLTELRPEIDASP